AAPLPGGEFHYNEIDERIDDFHKRHPLLGEGDARRLYRAYGTRADTIIGGARSVSDLGESFGRLSEREVDYLIREEWARTAEDIILRHTTLGLTIDLG